MKQFLLIAFFSFAVNAQAIEKSEFQDVCGELGKDSDFAFVLGGKVTKIIDSNTIFVKVEGKRRIVDLVAVNVNSNKTEAVKFLSDKILNQEVEILVSPSDFEDKKVFAVVHFKGKDINRSMIENAIARYEKPRPYKILRHTNCVYQHLEGKAKEAKLGIWAK